MCSRAHDLRPKTPPPTIRTLVGRAIVNAGSLYILESVSVNVIELVVGVWFSGPITACIVGSGSDYSPFCPELIDSGLHLAWLDWKLPFFLARH